MEEPDALRVGEIVPEGVTVGVPVTPAVLDPELLTVPLPVLLGVPVWLAVPLLLAPTDCVAVPVAESEADNETVVEPVTVPVAV